MVVPALASLTTYFHHVAHVRLDIAEGEWVDVPSERAARLAVLAGKLEREGFTPLTTVVPHKPGGVIYARVLVDSTDGIAAWAIDVVRWGIVLSYLELITEWEDGTAVSTVTHSTPPIFEPLPRLHKIVLPGRSVGTALARHREHCAGIRGLRLDPAGRDPIEVAQAHNREVLAHQEKCGIMRRRGEDYGFTLRGAWRSNLRIWRAKGGAV